jgi:hypothetical protein
MWVSSFPNAAMTGFSCRLMRWCRFADVLLISLFKVLTSSAMWIDVPVIYFILLWLYGPLLILGRFFSFLILYADGRTPWTGNQSNTSTQTSMPRVGFEPTIQAFVRAKTVHALDRAATVIGLGIDTPDNFVHNDLQILHIICGFIAPCGSTIQ